MSQEETSFNDVDDVLGLNFNADEVPVPPVPKQSRSRHVKDHHLTSVRGLPYVRKSAQKRVRKAMNHKDEYKNLTNFLSFYQIWGHNLFPKSKFKDFLEMCATAGTQRSVKLLRHQYMDEDAGARRDEDFRENFVPTTDIMLRGETERQQQEQQSQQQQDTRVTSTDAQEDEDYLFEQQFLARAQLDEESVRNAAKEHALATQASTTSQMHTTSPLPAVTRPEDASTATQNNTTSAQGTGQTDGFDDDFDDDDDDDFLAVLDKKKPAAAPAAAGDTSVTEPDMAEFEQDNYEDEYEAEMEFMREQGL